jgi:hypothetical protein
MAELDSGAAPRGSIGIKVQVGFLGNVDSVSIAPAEKLPPSLVSCVTSAVNASTFDAPPTGSATIEFLARFARRAAVAKTMSSSTGDKMCLPSTPCDELDIAIGKAQWTVPSK